MGTHLRNKIYGNSSLKLFFKQCSLWQAVWWGYIMRVRLSLCSLYFNEYILFLSVTGCVEGLYPEGQTGTGPGVRQVWGRGWLWLPGGGPQRFQLQRGLWSPYCAVGNMLSSQGISIHMNNFLCIHIYVTFYLLSMINANFNIVYKPSFFFVQSYLQKKLHYSYFKFVLILIQLCLKRLPFISSFAIAVIFTLICRKC